MRRTMLIGGAAAVLVGAAGAFGAWTLLRSDAPAPVSVSEAVRQAPATPPPIALSVPVAEPALSLISRKGTVQLDGAGRYQVVVGSSFVGYRVKEVLAGLGGNVAVGRSSEVTASFAFDGRNRSVSP